MARPLHVLFLSSEVEPFAKTGGLADVSGALPQSLRHLGLDVRVMMPRYGFINELHGPLIPVAETDEISIPVGPVQVPVRLFSSFLPNSGNPVPVYFLANDRFYGRKGLYVDPETATGYPDNDERFILFCRGALQSTEALGWKPDIIHCNDWPTGLVPAYLKTLLRERDYYRGTRTVFTIHNMAYQGLFDRAAFVKTGLPSGALAEDGLEAFGQMNWLKAGIVYADALTTVSEKYAEEIQGSDEFGCGLQDVARARRKDLHGILNGVDYSIWDPAVDQLLPRRYDAAGLEGKPENTRALRATLGLPWLDAVPVIGMISRLADQKGFDLLEPIIDLLMALPLQLVVLGTGEPRYHRMLEAAQRAHPGRIAIRLAFDNTLAHLIEAGSDMFLMPSRYEPCGLNQIYSLRYGTVPVVRATGGLDDTITDVVAHPEEGTGFKFTPYDSEALLHTVRQAVAAFADRPAWQAMMRRGMKKDFSWTASARRYADLYGSLSGIPA
jgi:starch synthase